MRQAPNELRVIIHAQITVIQKLYHQSIISDQRKVFQIFTKITKKSVNMLTEEEMLFEDQYVLDYLEEKDFSGTNRQFQVFLYDEVFQTILEVGYRSQIRRIDQSCFIQNYE